MSTCISSHGEYDDHEPDPDTYVCKWCHEFDETGALAEIARLRGGPVTGMEHAIEQVAKRLHSSYCECEGWHTECQGPQVGDRRVARRLAAEGLIAPAPLAEEWAARYVNGGGSVHETRHEAEAELGRMSRDSQRSRIDDPPAPPVAGIHVRWVTAWEPADGIDRSEGGGKAATSG